MLSFLFIFVCLELEENVKAGDTNYENLGPELLSKGKRVLFSSAASIQLGFICKCVLLFLKLLFNDFNLIGCVTLNK